MRGELKQGHHTVQADVMNTMFVYDWWWTNASRQQLARLQREPDRWHKANKAYMCMSHPNSPTWGTHTRTNAHTSRHIFRLSACNVFNELCRHNTNWPSTTAERGESSSSTRANTALYQVLNDILMVTTIFVKHGSFQRLFWLLTLSHQQQQQQQHRGLMCHIPRQPHWHKEPSKTEAYQSSEVTESGVGRLPFCCTLLCCGRWHHPLWSLSLKGDKYPVCVCSTQQWRERLGPWSQVDPNRRFEGVILRCAGAPLGRVPNHKMMSTIS